MMTANNLWIFLPSNKRFSKTWPVCSYSLLHCPYNMTILLANMANPMINQPNCTDDRPHDDWYGLPPHQTTNPWCISYHATHPSMPVPIHMLTQTNSWNPVPTYLLTHQPAPTMIVCGCHKHQHQFMTPMHHDLPCIHIMNVAPWPSLDNFSLNQLDHPLDHHHIIHGTLSMILILGSTTLPTTAQTQTAILWQKKPPFANMGISPMQQWPPWNPTLPVDCPHQSLSPPRPLFTQLPSCWQWSLTPLCYDFPTHQSQVLSIKSTLNHSSIYVCVA